MVLAAVLVLGAIAAPPPPAPVRSLAEWLPTPAPPHVLDSNVNRRSTEEVCAALASFTVSGGPGRLWGGRHKNNDAQVWYSSAAMPQLGAVEIAHTYPTSAAAKQVLPWAAALLDSYLQPGQPAADGLAGKAWTNWCDKNGVPPTLFAAMGRGTSQDRAAIHTFAEQARTFPGLGKVEGAGMLPDGAVARSTGGGWRVPLPPHNTTVVTWPDDCFSKKI